MILLEKEEDYKQKINCERAKKTAGGLSTTCPLPMHAWAPITRAVTSAYCDVRSATCDESRFCFYFPI